KKSELVWMASHSCEHRHKYIEHFGCYVRDKHKGEKLGFFDIEASGLDADWDQMLCWCILDDETDEIEYDYITKKDLNAKGDDEDKRIIKSCVDTIGKYDRLVTYFGARYDIPFLRARALITKVGFPYHHGAIKHRDLYDVIKRKFKLSSRR